jgi:hypothetical protein
MKNLNRKLSWERTYSQMAKEKEDWQDFDITMLDGIEIDEIASEINVETELPPRLPTNQMEIVITDKARSQFHHPHTKPDQQTSLPQHDH